jgi:3'-phosphoadenosine 5'-phosphosulfate (PAPS) 3'-phosphatase
MSKLLTTQLDSVVRVSGNKLLAIALKQANVFLVSKPAAYSWDLCAAHAIIQSIDGQIVDLRRILDVYKENACLTDIDLSTAAISYRSIQSGSFSPQDYACQAFVAFHHRQDLIEVLSSLSHHDIRMQ